MAEQLGLAIRIKNIGPHDDLALEFRAGVNVLTGRNGIGKSTAIAATVTAMGGAEPVTVRDGAIRGTVDVDGVTILQIGRTKTVTGSPSVELAGYSSVGQVIDPGIVNPVTADQHRVKAILSMVPVEANTTVLIEIAQGHADLIPAMGATSILEAADWIRKEANKRALEAERERDAAKARADVHRTNMPIERVEPGDMTVEDAQDAWAIASRDVERVRLLAERRVAEEKRIAEIAASLGERPDDEATKRDVEIAREALDAANREYDDIWKRYEDAKERRTATARVFAEAERVERRVAQQAKQYDEQRALVGKPIEGPVAADVVRAESVLAQATRDRDAATVRARVRAIQQQLGEETARFNAAFETAQKMREIAQAVSDRLGAVLASRGLESLEVLDGRLFITRDGKRLLFAERLSYGERTKVALNIALRAFKGRFIPIDPAFWSALQPSVQREVDDVAKTMNVVLVTEMPTDDDRISVVRVER